jgi:hypothetical protein
VEHAPDVPYAGRHDLNHIKSELWLAKIDVLIGQEVSMGIRFDSRSAHVQLMVEGLAQRNCSIVVPPKAVQDAAEQPEQKEKPSVILVICATDEHPNDTRRFGESSGMNMIPRFGRAALGHDFSAASLGASPG